MYKGFEFISTVMVEYLKAALLVQPWYYYKIQVS
jgi:hypothetical protein